MPKSKGQLDQGIEGDVNAKFFHGMVNWRRMMNSLIGLNIDGRWSEEPL